MKIKDGYELKKSNEDFKTSLMSVIIMPPSSRKEFAKSRAGQEFIKGISLVAENNKAADKQFGTTWTVDDIDRINEEVRQASPEDAEVLLSLLPGPVAAMVMDRMNPQKINKPNYSDWVKIKGDTHQEDNGLANKNKDAKRKMEKSIEQKDLIKGPRKGTPGYQIWLDKLRAKRQSKVGPDAMTRPTKNSKKPFKHFIRQVKENAQIVDKPIKNKSEKSY